MSKFYLQILIIFTFFTGTIRLSAQNYNWITPNQTYLKMYLFNDGIYRINKIDFINAGINPSIINPQTVKVFYKGNQIPIYFYGEQDGVFNDSDYFDFWGQRNYGGLTNSYNQNNQVVYTKDEYYDLYSDTSVYWVGWGGSAGLRYQIYTNSTTFQYPYDYYYKRAHFESNLVYTLGETNNSQSDFRYFNTEICQGEGWYWQYMAFNNTNTSTFPLIQLPSSTVMCRLKVFAYPGNKNTSIFNEHRLIIRINSNLVDTIEADDFNRIDTTLTFPSSYFTSGSGNNVSVRYFPSTNFTSGRMYYDFVEVEYPYKFTFDSNKINFTSELTDSSAIIFKISSYNNIKQVNIYDVVNNTRINNFSSSSDTLIYTGKGNGKFFIINDSITQKPFRIKQKQVPDLVSLSNGADYLIIYNKLFASEAEQLRLHRATFNNFRSIKAEVEDIYDIFNYGIENPVAVRNFTKYVYDNWQLPKLKFILLFGRASLDPKKYLTSSIYHQNLVPTYGNPPSDGYFSNFNIGTFTYYNQVNIGRIPVYNNTEAQAVVSKIIAYDNQTINRWSKQFTFIAAGYDKNEQAQFSALSNGLINTHVITPTTGAFVKKIYKNDSTGFMTFNLRDSIKNVLDSGTQVVNYIGHAGEGYWDDLGDMPGNLNNVPRLPLIISMTCFTGENSKAEKRGFGEKFIYYEDKGAIGFLGTTGWGYTGSGDIFNNHIFQGLKDDTLRYIGDIISYASYNMAPDSISFASRHTVNCYNLLGDPASKILIPKYPEFEINLSDYSISTTSPLLKQYIQLKVFPKNLGITADSVKMRFKLIKDGSDYKIKDTVLKNFGYCDTVIYNFRLDTLGIFSVYIKIDADNKFTQENEGNNEITIPIILKNISFYPLKPIDNVIITQDSAEFTGLNPFVKLSENSVKLFLQLDTSIYFNSPLLQTLYNSNPQGAITKFKIGLPVLTNNKLYYWRTRTIINNDTLEWCDTRRFICQTTLQDKKTDFDISGEKSNNILSPEKTGITVFKKFSGQYDTYDLYNTICKFDTVTLSKFQGSLKSICYAGDPWNASFFEVNNYWFPLVNSNNGGTQFYGLNIGKVDKNKGTLLDVRNYKNPDSLLPFLNTFDTTHILMLVKNAPLGVTRTLNATEKTKLREFGSILVDSVEITSWTQWAFISYKKTPNPIVSEVRSYGWYPVTASLNPEFQNIYGTVTHNLGPAHTWSYFNWDQLLYPKTSIKTDVYGVDKYEQEYLLYSDLTDNTFVNLDTLNAYTYPYLKIINKLQVDTVSLTQSDIIAYGGIPSPLFKSFTLNYQAPSEIAIDYNSIAKSDSLINEGDSLKVIFNFYNVGFRDVQQGVIVNYYLMNDNFSNKVSLRTDTMYGTLKIDSMWSARAKVKMTSFGIPTRQRTLNLAFEVIPLGTQNDYYSFNNTGYVYVTLRNTPNIHKVDFFADGVKLTGGEYVRINPDMVIKIGNILSSLQNSLINSEHLRTDNSLQRKENQSGYVIDTSLVRIFLNNNNFSVLNPKIQANNIRSDNNLREKITPNSFSVDGEDIVINFSPILKEGENTFKLVLKDLSGNYDSVKYTVYVSNELMVQDLYNYPNPMKNETYFIFSLAGLNRPTSCKIKIFTVSGRVAKIIDAPINIGYNQIFWDGRDNDGDYMANGIYFYKIIIEGDLQKETAIQKLVILK